MSKINYHTNSTSIEAYSNETKEKKTFIESNKITSYVYKIKNSTEKKQSIKENISGKYVNKIKFQNISNLKTIDASNYIYGGLTHSLYKSNVGVCLDTNGDLLIIRGMSHNLIKGMYKKYTRGYHYQVANLTSNRHEHKFNQIYISQNGMLIGENKKNNQHYSIDLEKISSGIEDSEQSVTITLNKYGRGISGNSFKLQTKSMSDLYLTYKEGKLFLEKIKTASREINYSVMGYDIRIPAKKNYTIKSIKPINNNLQIELRKGIKSRIVYLNPDNILLKKCIARKISHKPPQQFSSRMGCDPHEKYHAGQPFSSDRKGNFSSEYIPIFSSVVDKFRAHLKSAKDHKAQDENKKAFISIIKSIDPGFNALYRIASDKVKKYKNKNVKNSIADQQTMLALMQSNTADLLPVINSALGNKLPADLSNTIITLVKKLKISESISLQNSNIISGFFGVAVGGMPFNPGWFAGVVATLAKSYNLTFSRVDNNHISVIFSYRNKKSTVLIAGTGQGLERSLLSTHTINYMSVLPAEANLIIVTHCTKERDFSFTLSISDFESFSKQLYSSEEKIHFNQQLINQSVLKDRKGKELIIMLEAKSELRAQIGTLVNPTTYMVIPRTALGIRLALNLIELKSVSEKTITHYGEEIKNSLTVNLLIPETDLFHEEKIMPITLRQGTELWCYPLPLIEEYRPKNVISSKKNITFTTEHQEKKVSLKPENDEVPYPDKRYNRSFSLMEKEKIPLVITINKSLDIEKHRLKQCKLNNAKVAFLAEKLDKLKKTLMPQERNNLHKQCKVFLFCHYDNNQYRHGIKIYKLKKIEIRRLTILNELTATLPLTIISLATNNSISYNETLGEIDFLYHSQENNTPYDIKLNLPLIY